MLIQKLPDDVVNRIAAGEVVQRHVSVVKELLENSLDAGATEIRVTFENLTKLVVWDNGRGIHREDLPLAAVRHATSKLKSVEDFESLSTFGFRGEALASVSMVGRLSITSRTESSPVGFTLAYQDTQAIQKPRPTARPIGTTVTVQDLFYNSPHKRKLRFSDEYSRVLDVVQKYACLYNVKISCQKKTVDFISTPEDDLVESTRKVMALIYGKDLQQHLVSLEASHKHCSLRSEVAKPTFHTKKTQFILFVNNRLVESPVMQRQLEQVYGGKFLAFLSLTVPPNEVDVNVHPSKQQIVLLHQDEIIRFVALSVRNTVMDAGHSFVANPYQKENTNAEGSGAKTERKRMAADGEEETKRTVTQMQSAVKQTSEEPSKKIRTSLTPTGSIEPYLVSRSSCPLHSKKDIDLSQPGAFAVVASQCTCSNEEIHLPRQVMKRPRKIRASDCSYTSILSLRRRIEKKSEPTLTMQLRKSCFVGCISRYRSLIQCEDGLFQLNHYQAAIDMFYQIALNRFAEFDQAKLGEGGVGSVDIQLAVSNAVQFEEWIQQNDESRETPGPIPVDETNQSLGEQVASCLYEHSAMLQEYFSISIEKDETGRILLTGLPLLLEGTCPEPHSIPVFLLRLATEVHWEEEKPCFHGICRELGLLYAQLPNDNIHLDSYLRHGLFPSLSSLLIPSRNLVKDKQISMLTNLSILYKTFERC